MLKFIYRMELYLYRHGDYSRPDGLLTQQGISQMETIEELFSFAICKDNRRSIQSVEIATKKSISPTTDDRLGYSPTKIKELDNRFLEACKCGENLRFMSFESDNFGRQPNKSSAFSPNAYQFYQ